MKTLKEKLLVLLNEAQVKYDESLKSLTADVENQFAWVGEPLYKSANKIQQLNKLIKNVEESKVGITQERVLEFLSEKIMEGSLMDRSTGHLHSLTSLWKKEVTIEIYQGIKNHF